MKNLLIIKASLNGSAGLSSELAEQYAALWLERHPAGEVIRRVLAEAPIPHLDADRFASLKEVAEPAGALSDALISELAEADELVLGVPMHNFGIPSVLKSWIDHVAVAGKTFRYSASGPEGLLSHLSAQVIQTRGGRYRDTPADSQTPYLRQVLAFLGITNVVFTFAEGTAIGGDSRQQAIDDATANFSTPANELMAEGS